uniref:snRNA-activating protein complex subunit 3 n=1 Tax=Aceria tosichella TaxID=561515 RepID=A0A6G1SE50_9ACAR
MDSIHDVASKPWISSNRLHIKDLAARRAQLLFENNITLDGSGFRGENCNYLEDKLEEFIAQDEKKVRPYFLFNSTDERVLTKEPKCKLKMYQRQLEHAKRMISDRSYKVNYLSRLNTTRRETLMRHYVLTNRQEQVDDNGEQACDDVEEDCKTSIAVILVVQVWPQPKKNERLRLETEILFKSDQCLTTLRNQLKCHRDFANPMDLSDNPEQQIDRVFRGELFKSGMFLIENTFYNDMRDVNNTDMSEPIIRWASEKVTVLDEDNRNARVSRGIGPFERAQMEKTNFEDLIIRLGYPYLYLHQGNCEHLFCISDIRYAQNNRRLRKMKFPFVVAPACGRKEDALKCYMCKIGPPHWYTRYNSRLPVDPYFFCENCFKSFNYDKSKRKIGKFRAYLWNWPGQIA